MNISRKLLSTLAAAALALAGFGTATAITAPPADAADITSAATKENQIQALKWLGQLNAEVRAKSQTPLTKE